jgi:hypothetical protein
MRATAPGNLLEASILVGIDGDGDGWESVCDGWKKVFG